MTFDQFLSNNSSFSDQSTNEQICRVAWYLNRVLEQERFSPRDIIDQFKNAHLNAPRADVYLPRLAAKKPAPILADKRGYYLEGRERKRLDNVLAPKASTAEVSELLRSLTDSVQGGPEKIFLTEAVRCYEVTAFRAAIVMAWNLAYDHMRRWIIADAVRLQGFNEGAQKRFQRAPKPPIVSLSDFDDFKESEFIDACASGKLINKSLETLLREKLRRRNLAAHPSNITISQPQADDVISDLVQNVILAL